MGKRKQDGRGGDGKKFKKYKMATGIVEPGQYGVYATCPKFKEKACMKELTMLFEDKIEEYYPDNELDSDEEDDELSIEDAIKKEVSDMKDNSKEAKKLKKITAVDLGCECLVFMKCRKPVVPSELVTKVCQECLDSKQKNTTFTQRLSPIDISCNATIEELKKMTLKVLKPHFHNEIDQKPLKFAIQINKRNFNQLQRGDIINNIAGCVGNEHGHKVDLKNYDKLILVECFKSSIGMSVVENYDKLYRFNLQQIFEKANEEKEDEVKEVKEDEVKEEVQDKEDSI